MNKEDVKYIVVHCSITPPSMDIGARQIDRLHRERGFLGCGYHFVIKRDGTLEFGRPLHRAGAHVRRKNKFTVGICLIGGMRQDNPNPEINYTDKQMAVLRETIDKLIAEEFPTATVKGHVDFDKGKTCPNFDAGHWYETDEIIPTI
jgi:N-acetylmuramoyl-L-alanine amidase|tara:strand:+ start:3844 stop:4284 length:441 start_codon:yes stop_codon:yes gene_type:complete